MTGKLKGKRKTNTCVMPSFLPPWKRFNSGAMLSRLTEILTGSSRLKLMGSLRRRVAIWIF